MDVEIAFTPSGRRGRFEVGTSILDAARAMGVDLDSVCGGRGVCGRCQVGLGTQPGIGADSDRLSPPGPLETEYRGKRPLEPDLRLGCATRAMADVVIDVPEQSQIHRQVIRKEAGVRSLPVDPAVRLVYLELDAAGSDEQQVRRVLAADWGIDIREIDEHAAEILAADIESVTVAIRDSALVAAWIGYQDEMYGMAFDVGSTTIAGHLCDLSTGAVLASAGTMNPQISYGEDLMSRVTYAQMNPQGAERLTAVVREAVSRLSTQLCEQAGIDPDLVLEVVAVGNPIMHHLLLGLDPTPLGVAPFTLAISDAHTERAHPLGLAVNSGARLYTLPCIAGHVGADATAVVLAEGPHRQDEILLVVDVGTNAEIILGNRHRLVAASSPTGPAFEGAEITSGQRAAPGAIERVRIDRETARARVKVIGDDRWSDETGFDPKSITGICGSGIIEAVAEMHLAGLIGSDGLILEGPHVFADNRTFSYRLIDGVTITQADVRAIQLAKAALQAGARLLMDHLGVNQVDRIRLAGAFGNHVDPLYALVLGMLPDCDPDRVTGAGNAAGIGAMMALLSVTSRQEIEQVSGRIEHVETATQPRFQEHFVAGLAFPTAKGAYARLERRVDLPDPSRHNRTRRRRGS